MSHSSKPPSHPPGQEGGGITKARSTIKSLFSRHSHKLSRDGHGVGELPATEASPASVKQMQLLQQQQARQKPDEPMPVPDVTVTRASTKSSSVERVSFDGDGDGEGGGDDDGDDEVSDAARHDKAEDRKALEQDAPRKKTTDAVMVATSGPLDDPTF